MRWESYEVNEQLYIAKFHSFFEAHYDEGYDFPGESHNFWECVYVMEGTMYVSGDDRVYNLEKGQIIFHKPMELHKFHINNKEGASLLIFSFSLEGNMAAELQDKVYRLSDAQKGIISSLYNYMVQVLGNYLNPPSGSTIHYFTHPFADNPIYSQMVTSYIYLLFLSLLDNGKVSRVSKAPDALLFSKAVNYMINQMPLQPSVSEIAQAVCTSESTLKRIFQKYAGISVHKYALEMKIKTATLLLQNGASVTEVADKLCFSSQAYFSTCYRRETGVYPSEVE